METNEFIEKQVWAYLDDTLPQSEKLRVKENISKSREWKNAYENALFIHNNLLNVPLEEPSPGFSARVMERVETSPKKKEAQRPVVVPAIVVFFAVCILALVFNINGSADADHGFVHHVTQDIIKEQKQVLKQNVNYGFTCMSILLFLVLLDKLLVKRHGEGSVRIND